METRRRPDSHRNCTGFNGAMTFQSWKLVEGMGSVNPAAKLQWSHDLSVMETSFVTPFTMNAGCFNGAMTFQSWKLAEGNTSRCHAVASMEP